MMDDTQAGAGPSGVPESSEISMHWDLWEVHTRKRTLEGLVQDIREHVQPVHELLPQSLAPGFVKGNCSDPKCTVTTYLIRNFNGNRHTIEMKTEFTSPEWNLWEQRQLEPYRHTALDTALSTAAIISKKTRDVSATQVAPKVIALRKAVRSKAMTICDIIARSYKETIRAFLLACLLFLAVSIPVMLQAYITPDTMLDRSLEINAEITSILQNISVQEMPMQRMAEEGTDKNSMILSVVISRLAEKNTMGTYFADEHRSLKSLGKEMEDLRFQVQWLGMELYTTHEKALFYLRRRSDLPRSRLRRYLERARRPTLKEIRQGLVDEPLRLSDLLDVPVEMADSVERNLEALARHLERTGWHLGQSQHTREDELRRLDKALSSTWWGRFWSKLNGPSPEQEQMVRDIETAEKARNRTRDLQDLVASVPMRAVQEDLRRVRAGLRLVDDPQPLLRLKVFFWAGVTEEQQAAVERVVELASYFKKQPLHLPDDDLLGR